MMNGCCHKCTKLCAGLLLVFGVLFLVSDLTGWSFWGIQWWTVVFLLAGLGGLGKSGCPDCQVASGMPSKKRR